MEAVSIPAHFATADERLWLEESTPERLKGAGGWRGPTIVRIVSNVPQVRWLGFRFW